MDTHGINLADRADGEEHIDSKVGGVHRTDNDLRPTEILCLWCIIMALVSCVYAVQF